MTLAGQSCATPRVYRFSMDLKPTSSSPEEESNRLRICQWVCLAAGVLIVANTVPDLLQKGAWHSPWLLIGIGCIAASLALLVWRVRMEARRTRRPVTATAAFTSTVFGAALLLIACGTMIAGLLLGRTIARPVGPDLTASILLGVLCIRLTAARITIINKLLREGREPPVGAFILQGVANPVPGSPGRWWMAEVAVVAGGCLLLALNSLLSGSTSILGYLFLTTLLLWYPLYVAWAFNRGLDWPNQEAQKEAAARWRETQERPEFQIYQARYKRLEAYAVGVMIAGVLLTYPVGRWAFSDGHDARWLWLIGTMFGGMAGWPALFIFTMLRRRGRANWDDYVACNKLLHGEGATNSFMRFAIGSVLLLVICAIGLLVSVLPSASVHAH